MIEWMEKHEDVGLCAPLLIYENGKWQGGVGSAYSPGSAFRFALGLGEIETLRLRLYRRVMAKRPPAAIDAGFIAGACLLVRRVMTEQIGKLDERYFMYAEDMEFCVRAVQNGWRVVCLLGVEVVHLGGQSGTTRNLQRGLQMRHESRRRFVSEVYGESGWHKYLFWTRLGMGVRYRIFTALSILSSGSFEKRRDFYRMALSTLQE
jgi:GT2 family glycosyltransferase